MRDLVPTPPLTSPLYTTHTSRGSCLPMFLIYQPEDGQWKGLKHVVVLYVINYTYLYHHIVVLDRYTNSNLVYYKHNGDDEPYDYCNMFQLMYNTAYARISSSQQYVQVKTTAALPCHYHFMNTLYSSYVYWTVHHCDSWRIKGQLDVTCYFISLVCSTDFNRIVASSLWWIY